MPIHATGLSLCSHQQHPPLEHSDGVTHAGSHHICVLLLPNGNDATPLLCDANQVQIV